MNPLPRKSQLTLHSALALLLLVISAVAILFFYASPPEMEDATLGSLFRAVVPRFFIALFLLVLAMEYFPASLSSKRVSGKNLLWCILPLLVALVNFPFSSLIRSVAYVTRADLLGLFLFKCFLIGLGEEILFRGIILDLLLQSFQKKRGAIFWPVFLSSAIFALFHFINLIDGADILSVLQQVGYSFLIGAMLAVVLLQTRNLWLCIALHALFDAGGFLISDLGGGNPQDLTFWILTIIVGVGCTVQMIITLVKQQKRLLG